MKKLSQTFTPNKRWRSLRQKAKHMKQPFDFRNRWTMLHENTRVGSLIFAAMLLVVVALSSGCHTQPIKPCVEPKIPMPPASQMQAPSQSYSASAAQSFKTWQSLLMVGTTKP